MVSCSLCPTKVETNVSLEVIGSVPVGGIDHYQVGRKSHKEGPRSPLREEISLRGWEGLFWGRDGLRKL